MALFPSFLLVLFLVLLFVLTITGAGVLKMHNVVRKLRIVPAPQAKEVKHHVQKSLVVSTNMFGCEMLSCK